MDIYADSFGDAGRQAIEIARYHQAGLAQSIQQLQSAQQMAQNHALALRQLQFQMQEAHDRGLERGRQLDIDEAYRNALGERALGTEEVQKGYLKLAQDQAAKNLPSASDERNAQWEFNQANVDAESGRFGAPDEVSKVYPTVSAPHAMALAGRSLQIRAQHKSAYDASNRAADIANQSIGSEVDNNPQDPLAKDISAEKKKQSSRFLFWGGPTQEQRDTVDALSARRANLLAAASSIKQNPRAYNVAFDPESNKFVPLVPQAPWMTEQPDQGQGQGKQAPGGGGRTINLAPNDATVTNSPAVSKTGTGTSGYTAKYPPAFYDVVNKFISQGMDPVAAKRSAMALYQ